MSTAPDQPHFPELGFYVLGGQPTSSRTALTEVRDGEQMGLDTAFISERFHLKEIGALCGATPQVLAPIVKAYRQ